MCKVLMLTDMSKVKEVSKLVNLVNKVLNEPDGFGYAIQGESGLFGEKTTDTKDFKYSMFRKYLDHNFLDASYSRFGKYSRPIGSGLFHGRTSTNDLNITNTHPIQKHDWTLIHNGVVTDHGPKYSMVTSNDTEHVLERLATGGIDSVATHLTGYYAIGAFDPIGQLHVFRDDRAPLYFAEVTTINSFIIATTKTSIERVCKEMKWSVSLISKVKDNTYIVFNRNKIISHSGFTPRGATLAENRYADLSLRESIRGARHNIQDYSIQDFNYSSYFDDRESESYEKYSKDELYFLDEIETQVDESYLILDSKENQIELEEFLSYSVEDQLSCILVRPDGTVMDSYSYSTNRLYSGLAIERKD